MPKENWYLHKPWGRTTTPGRFGIVEELWIDDYIGELSKTPNGWEFWPTNGTPEPVQQRYFFGTIENAKKMAAQFMADAEAQGLEPSQMPVQPNVQGWVESGNDYGGKTLWRHPDYGDLYVGNKSGRVTDFRPAGAMFEYKTHYVRPEGWGSFKSFEEARKQIPDIVETAYATGRAPWDDQVEAGKEKLAAERAVSRAAETPVKPAAAAAAAFAGQRIIIIPCSATKNPVSGPTAARDLYTGSNFQGNLKAAIAQVGEANVRIMSAKHGLLGLDDKIEPYDVKMGSAESLSQNERRFIDFGLQLSDLRGAQIETMLPQQYLKILKKAAALPSGVGVEIGVDHFAGSRGIGDQRSVAKKLLGLGENPVPPMPKVTLGKAKPVEAPVPSQPSGETAIEFVARRAAESTIDRTSDLNEVAAGEKKYNPIKVLAALRAAHDAGGGDKKVLQAVMQELWATNKKIMEFENGKENLPRGFVARLEMLENTLFNKAQAGEAARAEEAAKTKLEQGPNFKNIVPKTPHQLASSPDLHTTYTSEEYVNPHLARSVKVTPETKALIDAKYPLIREYQDLAYNDLKKLRMAAPNQWDEIAAENGLETQLARFRQLDEQLAYLESGIQHGLAGMAIPAIPPGILDAAPAPSPTQMAASQMAEQIVADDPVLAAYKQRYPQIPEWRKMESFQRPGEFAWIPQYGPEDSRSPSFREEKYFGDQQFYTQFYTPAHEARLKYLMGKYPGVNQSQPLNVSEKKFKPANATELNESTELIALYRLKDKADAIAIDMFPSGKSERLDPVTGKTNTSELVGKFEQTDDSEDYMAAIGANGMDPTWRYGDVAVNPVPPYTESDFVVDQYREALADVRGLYDKLNQYGKDDEVKKRVAEIIGLGFLPGFVASKSKSALKQVQHLEQGLRSQFNKSMISAVMTQTPIEQFPPAATPTAQSMATQAVTNSVNPTVAAQAAQNVSGPARTLNPAAVARALNPAKALPGVKIMGELSPPTPDPFLEMLKTARLGPVEENMALIPNRSRTRGARAAEKFLRGANNEFLARQMLGENTRAIPLDTVVRAQAQMNPTPMQQLQRFIAAQERAANPGGTYGLRSPGGTGFFSSNTVPGPLYGPPSPPVYGPPVPVAGAGRPPLQLGTGIQGRLAGQVQQAAAEAGNIGRAMGGGQFGTGLTAPRPLSAGPAIPGYSYNPVSAGQYSFAGAQGSVGGGINAVGGGVPYGPPVPVGGAGQPPLAIGPTGNPGFSGVPGAAGGGAGGGGNVGGAGLLGGARNFFGYNPASMGLSFTGPLNPVGAAASRGFGMAPGLLADQAALSGLAKKGALRATGASLVQGAPLLGAEIAKAGMNALTPKQYRDDAAYRFTQGAMTGAALGAIVPGLNAITIPAGAVLGGAGNTLLGWFRDRSETQLGNENDRRYARLAGLMDTAGLTAKQRAAMKARYDTQVMLADGDSTQVQSFLDQMEQQIVGLAGTNPYSLTGQDLIGLQAEIAKSLAPLQERMTASNAGLAAAYNQIASQMSNPQIADAARLQGANVQANADRMNLAISQMGTVLPMNYAYTLDRTQPAAAGLPTLTQ